VTFLKNLIGNFFMFDSYQRERLYFYVLDKELDVKELMMKIFAIPNRGVRFQD
jgi:hypothetical protein